jgi:hypothetical protein
MHRRQLLIGATWIPLLLSFGCAKEELLQRRPAPSGDVYATLTRSAAGAWDKFTYDVRLHTAHRRIHVALIRQPTIQGSQAVIDLIWRDDSTLVIEFDRASRAELSNSKVKLNGRQIRVILSGSTAP